jgi:hypothetical protein
MVDGDIRPPAKQSTAGRQWLRRDGRNQRRTYQSLAVATIARWWTAILGLLRSNPPPGGGGYEETEEIREERSYKSGWRADLWAAGSGMNDGGRILEFSDSCYIKRRKT